MGLDQYAVAEKAGEENITFANWRKHRNLHTYMEGVYQRQCRQNDERIQCFNGVDLYLNLHDLDELERHHPLPFVSHRHHFNWGQSTPEDDVTTREFIARARELLVNEYDVYYRFSY